MQTNRQDLGAGLMFVAIGGAFAGYAWLGLRLGTPTSMGPGFFPVVLGVILVGFGVAIIARSLGTPAEPAGDVPWLGIGLIAGAVLLFALTARGLGLGPSLFAGTAMASLAVDRASWRSGLLVSAALTLFCIALFVYGLRLPFRVVGPWLTG